MLDRRSIYLAALAFFASAEAFSVSSPAFGARAALSLRNGCGRQAPLGLRMSNNNPKVRTIGAVVVWNRNQKCGNSHLIPFLCKFFGWELVLFLPTNKDKFRSLRIVYALASPPSTDLRAHAYGYDFHERAVCGGWRENPMALYLSCAYEPVSYDHMSVVASVYFPVIECALSQEQTGCHLLFFTRINNICNL